MTRDEHAPTRVRSGTRVPKVAAICTALALGGAALAVLAAPRDEGDRAGAGAHASPARASPTAAGAVFRPAPEPAPASSLATGARVALLEPPTAASGPVSDDLPQESRAPRAGTEAALYEHYLALGRLADGALDVAAERVLGGPSAVDERVAVLRALWDSGSPDRGKWLKAALAETGETEPVVSDFAVRFLGDRAAREPEARSILADHVADSPEGCDAARLARAAAALEPTAPSQEP